MWHVVAVLKVSVCLSVRLSRPGIIASKQLNLTSKFFHVLLFTARRYASAGNSDRNVSVCLSVTRRYCVKTKKFSGMISSPSGSPKTLVF